MSLPGESCKKGCGKTAGCRGVKTVEGIDNIRRVGEMSSGFPAVVANIVALPLHKILVLVMILMAVKDLFDLYSSLLSI